MQAPGFPLGDVGKTVTGQCKDASICPLPPPAVSGQEQGASLASEVEEPMFHLTSLAQPETVAKP